jgi:hypothetical protein
MGVVAGANDGQDGRGGGETVIVGLGRTEIWAGEVRICQRPTRTGMAFR